MPAVYFSIDESSLANKRPIQSGVCAALRHRTPRCSRVRVTFSNRRSFWSAVAQRSADTALDSTPTGRVGRSLVLGISYSDIFSLPSHVL
jgi:hypothetical protein